MAVELSVVEARALALVLGAVLRERVVAGRPLPYGVVESYRRLDLRIAEASAPGQSSEGDAPESLIGTGTAAAILGWGERRVRRHAADLDGRKVGDCLLYPERAVREYAEALIDKEIDSE